MTDKSKISPKGDLAVIFNFTPADLALNRLGDLTEVQSTQLCKEFMLKAILLVGTLLVFGLISVNEVTNLNIPRTHAIRLLSVIFPVIYACLAVPISVLGGKAVYHLLLDYRAGRTEIAAGSINVYTDLNKDVNPRIPRRFFLRVEQQHFELKPNQYQALTKGHRYAVYYLPYSRRILSVEWLKANREPQQQTQKQKIV